MKVSQNIQGKRAVLGISGQFAFESAMQFRQVAVDMTKRSDIAVVEVDLREATYIDSSALGVMLLLRDMARKAGMTVEISNCRGTVREALDRARFGNLFAMTP